MPDSLAIYLAGRISTWPATIEAAKQQEADKAVESEKRKITVKMGGSEYAFVGIKQELNVTPSNRDRWKPLPQNDNRAGIVHTVFNEAAVGLLKYELSKDINVPGIRDKLAAVVRRFGGANIPMFSDSSSYLFSLLNKIGELNSRFAPGSGYGIIIYENEKGRITRANLILGSAPGESYLEVRDDESGEVISTISQNAEVDTIFSNELFSGDFEFGCDGSVYRNGVPIGKDTGADSSCGTGSCAGELVDPFTMRRVGYRGRIPDFSAPNGVYSADFRPMYVEMNPQASLGIEGNPYVRPDLPNKIAARAETYSFDEANSLGLFSSSIFDNPDYGYLFRSYGASDDDENIGLTVVFFFDISGNPIGFVGRQVDFIIDKNGNPITQFILNAEDRRALQFWIRGNCEGDSGAKEWTQLLNPMVQKVHIRRDLPEETGGTNVPDVPNKIATHEESIGTEEGNE